MQSAESKTDLLTVKAACRSNSSIPEFYGCNTRLVIPCVLRRDPKEKTYQAGAQGMLGSFSLHAFTDEDTEVQKYQHSQLCSKTKEAAFPSVVRLNDPSPNQQGSPMYSAPVKSPDVSNRNYFGEVLKLYCYLPVA